MSIKIRDVFRYYDVNGKLWLGAVKHRTQSQMSVEWLLPVQARNKPSLRWSQITLFDKAWE